jgi:hypothetical protein
MLQILGFCTRRRRKFAAEQRVRWLGDLHFAERDWVVEWGIK